ncbi:MAG: 3-deoxy-8-phosphooctulonate synthase [Alphaproteobacteria bacterium]|nr:3-deoxy-8-phosphooctulonate synthase [Alphaproteobacteria bacterium]
MDSGCHVRAGSVTIGNDLPFVLISGPCQIENRDHAFFVAERLLTMTTRRGIGFIYKSSFDKANRTSFDGARGAGMDEGLQILDDVRSRLGCPVLTDVHLPDQCPAVAGAVDVLQIPAFLCRQTDLLVAAAKTGKTVNVKKGQFLAPWDMAHVVNKITASGNSHVMVTERGTSFGYNTLVSDMRAIPQLAVDGTPVVFDATHSVQQPGGRGGASGGQREYVPLLAQAAVAVGVAAVFMESHEEPDRAPSDGATMMALDDMPVLLDRLLAIDSLTKGRKP